MRVKVKQGLQIAALRLHTYVALSAKEERHDKLIGFAYHHRLIEHLTALRKRQENQLFRGFKHRVRIWICHLTLMFLDQCQRINVPPHFHFSEKGLIMHIIAYIIFSSAWMKWFEIPTSLAPSRWSVWFDRFSNGLVYHLRIPLFLFGPSNTI